MASKRELRKFRREFDSELDRRLNLVVNHNDMGLNLHGVLEGMHSRILTHCRRNVRLSGTINDEALHDLTWEWTQSFVVTRFPKELADLKEKGLSVDEEFKTAKKKLLE